MDASSSENDKPMHAGGAASEEEGSSSGGEALKEFFSSPNDKPVDAHGASDEEAASEELASSEEEAEQAASSSENDKPMHALSASEEEAASAKEISSSENDKPVSRKKVAGGRAAVYVAHTGGGDGALSSENDKPVLRKKVAGGRAARGVVAGGRAAAGDKRDEPDTSGDSEAQRGVGTKARISKKKRVRKVSGNSSDSSGAQSEVAGKEESRTNMQLRRRSSINYKEADPAEVKDVQQILMTRLETLKKDIAVFSREVTVEETHRKVMAFLLTPIMRIDVQESRVEGDGGFAAKDVKTGDVLGVLTSTMLSRRLAKDKERTFQGLTWGKDDECIAGFVNSCCVVHKKLKRGQERDCPSNTEFRMVKVKHGETWLWYVVLMASRDIAQDEELFAYYLVKNPKKIANRDDSADGDDDAEESDEEAEDKGSAAQGGSARRVSSKQSQKAPEAPKPPPPAHNRAARTRGGRGRGYNFRGGGGGSALLRTETPDEEREVVRSKGPARVRGRKGAQRGPLYRARPMPQGPEPTFSAEEMSYDTSDPEKQAAIEAKRARRAARDAEVAVSPPAGDEDVPESQYAATDSHSRRRGQSSLGEW